MTALGNSQLKTTAETMFAQQAREIGELQRLRESTASASR